jgi:hypothetical protein
MSFIYLDRSGKSRKVVVNDWENKIWDGSRGRYGYWCMFNLNNLWYTSKVTDAEVNAGDGFNWTWHIKWS